jgi:Protein of unknown function (DUF2752)
VTGDSLRGGLQSMSRHPAAAPLGVLAAAAASAAYLSRANPHRPGHLLPRCPFNWATGLLCPFCGGTRMAYDLLHGDWTTALHDNTALLAAVPFVLAVHVRWLVAGVRGREWRPALGPWGTVTVVVVAVVWAVVRNVVRIY